MSGIFCVHSGSEIDQAPERYLGALRLLAHRGPDGEGSVLRRSLFLGVRRSSVGRRCASQQPLVSSDGRILVALDGHIHNGEELSNSLRAKGHQADLSSDAAIVLAAYLEYGEQCFEKLRGVWALVLWDEREQRLLLGRDPLGVRPLYYHTGIRNLVVASEIKSILSFDPDTRSVDRARLRDLLRDARIDDWTGTCFSGIKPVPPGTILSFSRDRVVANQFWNLRLSTDQDLTPRDVLEKLVSAVDRHTPPLVPVGLALSGGIDSSSIAGILAHSSLRGARSVQAFSIKPPNTPDESDLIDATIRHTGIPHSYVSLEGLDYSSSLVRLLECQDEPVQSSGVFYQFFLRQRMVEAGCKAVLVGYGADEIFGGYRYLAPPFLAALFWDWRFKDAARFLSGASEFFESPPRTLLQWTLRHARQRARAVLVRSARAAFPEKFSTRRSASSGPGLDVLAAFDEPQELESPSTFAEDGIRGLRHGRIFFDALLQCFRQNIPLQVRSEDRNAAAFGMDLCTPFMDEDLVRTALAFPFYRYLEGGRNKAVLRDAVHDLLAPEVSGYRRKLATPGNNTHLAFDVLHPEFLDMLNSSSFRDSGLWSPACSDLYKSDFARKDRSSLWFRVYMTQKWYERRIQSH